MTVEEWMGVIAVVAGTVGTIFWTNYSSWKKAKRAEENDEEQRKQQLYDYVMSEVKKNTREQTEFLNQQIVKFQNEINDLNNKKETMRKEYDAQITKLRKEIERLQRIIIVYRNKYGGLDIEEFKEDDF